jgi:hypothetical protein
MLFMQDKHVNGLARFPAGTAEVVNRVTELTANDQVDCALWSKLLNSKRTIFGVGLAK